ncbi:MAG: hypothetical protein GVY12_11930 [Bacteroidetes bacterium]|nr:hypothetical protein [Bacteroidota bacterium]
MCDILWTSLLLPFTFIGNEVFVVLNGMRLLGFRAQRQPDSVRCEVLRHRKRHHASRELGGVDDLHGTDANAAA